MKNAVEHLVSEFERGRISRRDLVGKLCAVAMVGAAAGKASAAEASMFTATGLNHIALNVPDVAKSRDFYVKHLGMTLTRDSASSCFLTCKDNFLALFRGSTPGLNHYCFSVEGYDVEKSETLLTDAGLEPRRTGQRIYFGDPDGIEVQLCAEDHRA